MCADMKEVNTMNLKGSAKQEDESSPHPPYSPDLAPSDLHLFSTLKVAFRGRCFADDDNEMKYSVREQRRRFSKECYVTGIQRPTRRWKKCVDNGDFVKNNLNFAKDVPMRYVKFIITEIIVSEKQMEALLSYRLS
jgi:hypothetical protein